MSPDQQAWKEAPISMFFATCGGIGHLPGGPGTYAAILALPSIWWLSMVLSPAQHIGLVAVVTVLSCLWCDRAGKALNEEDSRKIVIDEWVGVWITLAPFSALGVWDLLVGLVAFRLFDIVKPWPVRWADKNVKGGVGVMLDDVLAAFLAILVVLAFRTLSV